MAEPEAAVVATPAKDAATLQKLAQEEAYRREVVKLIFGNAGLILSDFSCAVEAKMTLHGRMYVTTRFVCFYSNFFGFEKKIILPYRSINCVAKTPNSVFVSPGVEVSTSRQDYVFRNFWDREEAFKILRDCHRAGLGEPNLQDSVFPDLVKQIRSSQAARRAAKEELRRRQDGTDAALDAALVPMRTAPLTKPPAPASKSPAPKDTVATAPVAATLSSPPPARGASSALGPATPTASAPSTGLPAPAKALPPPAPASVKRVVATETEGSSAAAPRSTPSPPAVEGPDASGAGLSLPDCMETGSGGEGVVEEVVDEEAVPAPLEPKLDARQRYRMARTNRKLAHSLVTETFPEMSIETFWSLFLADDAAFPMDAFHVNRGDSEMTCEDWSAGAEAKPDTTGAGPDAEPMDEALCCSGLVRSLRFRSPVKAPVGPSSTRARKVQRARRFGDLGLILDSSTSLEDIPMGECFTVEDAWFLEQVAPGELRLEVVFEVTFHKSLMLKSLVASKSKTDTQAFYDDWAKAAKAFWQQKRHRPSAPVRSASPQDAVAKAPGVAAAPVHHAKSKSVEAKVEKGKAKARAEPQWSIPVIPWLLALLFGGLYLSSGGPTSEDDMRRMTTSMEHIETQLRHVNQRLARLEEALGGPRATDSQRS